MNTLLLAVLVLFSLVLFNAVSPKAQPPQVIYVRAEPRDAKREEGAGCLPFIVLALVVILAVGLL